MHKDNYVLGNADKSKLFLINEDNKYDYKMEEFKFDKNRKNDSHVSIINAVKENSLVLDIGCATGLIANILVKEKNCVVDGIEYDSEAFKICKKNKVFRNVFNFSIIDSNNVEYKNFFSKNNKYDYIILADVLEHLTNPWEALININTLLKDDGKIIISLPNIGHIDIIKGLINGNFNYNTLGLLDTTHLRFFTFRSFCDLIKNISETSHISYDIERIDKILSIPNYVTTGEDYSLYNLNSYLEEYFILQNIIVLTKSKDSKVHIKGLDDLNSNLFNTMLEEFNDLRKFQIDNKNNDNKQLILKLREENSNIKIQLNNFKGEYVKLNDTIYRLGNELESKKNELHKIFSSKRWKFVNNFCNCLRFRRRK